MKNIIFEFRPAEYGMYGIPNFSAIEMTSFWGLHMQILEIRNVQNIFSKRSKRVLDDVDSISKKYSTQDSLLYSDTESPTPDCLITYTMHPSLEISSLYWHEALFSVEGIYKIRDLQPEKSQVAVLTAIFF